ncbi:MAG: SDR family oxidoreductase [Acidimicrobiales bacterium]
MTPSPPRSPVPRVRPGHAASAECRWRTVRSLAFGAWRCRRLSWRPREGCSVQDQVTVMITGCSSGFGRAAALQFVEQGHQVAATMRNLDSADSLVEDARASAGELAVIELDVTDEDDRRSAVDQVMDRYGRLDVLVNNAGIAQFGPLEATEPDVLRLVMETDFFAPAELMRLVLPIMRDQGEGRIINVTSGAAHGVSAYLSAYGSAKHALDALTATVDLEASRFGVRVVSVVPGTFPTTGVATNVMTAPEIEPYGDGHVQLMRALETAFADRTDYSVVTDAIVNAATSPEPDFIALAGSELAARTGPVIAAKQEFHTKLQN